MTELFFENLLNLGLDWKVEKVSYDAESKEVDIHLKFQIAHYKKNQPQ